ncbi:DUF4302 domain-containing protein [Chitinophaga sp. CF418]|uniref:DUF4302 domain-containing protein n=1 Tax=Chitinophaga sp. CF418 TaxID=1855287 RepID=UPI00090EE4D6|nr:DUF4302 domain-containing protein [Chitinophaga sp. CF418]SHM94812.1 protein of unknown function [Chitinophaga sp. CF418]
MYKRLLLICFTLSVLAACRKSDESVFSAGPDTRLNDTLKKYGDILVAAPHGWKGLVYPQGLENGVFSFFFQFNDSNRVKMYADFDSASSVTRMESSYRLKALQQPCLLFDTYSYIHLLSDPDAAVNGGVYGEGLYSDFEFSIEGMNGDTILLKGRYHNSKAVLIKATEAEEAAYAAEKTNRLIDKIDTYLTYFKRFATGGSNYDVAFNILSRSATFSWIDENGQSHVVTTGFYYTPSGVGFSPAVNIGAVTLTSFDNITWSAATTTLNFTVNGNAGTIKETAKPQVIDRDAPKTWWQQQVDAGSYWVTLEGFHVDGVDDAYGITKLPNYSFTVFYPQFGTSDNIQYDLLGFVTRVDGEQSIEYGPAFRAPTYKADGRIVFPYLGILGDLPEGQTAVTNTITRITDSNGYYLVKTSDGYDMVSAKDGKSWISWF